MSRNDLKIVGTMTFTQQDRWFVKIKLDDKSEYVFYYCYETREHAEKVRFACYENFGKPTDIETDLSFNYRRYRRGIKYSIAHRATNNGAWFIIGVEK